MTPQHIPLYRRAAFQRVAGSAWRPGGPELTRHALALAALPAAARVLDVGCGAGASLDEVRAAGLRGVGLDAVCALPRLPAAHAPFVLGDGGHLPFRTAVFDAVLCECVLSLLADPAAAVRGVARVLRPKGYLLLTDMYVRGLRGGPADSGLTRQAGASCLAGAMPRAAVDAVLAQAGLRLHLFEDHSARLKELAARLIWYGGAELGAQDVLGAGTACGCGSSVRYGYGLWIAEKE